VAQVLLIQLQAPLVAFGGEVVDARGVIADFPSQSMLTGLFANALGWRRSERERLARLQERIVFAARLDREAERLTDFQTAALNGGDRGWTTRGRPEGRAGGANTYLSPHIRRRDFDADAAVTVALRLEPPNEAPDVEALAAALDEPVRPLFLGRKSCPPATPLKLDLVEMPDLTAAIMEVPLVADSQTEQIRLLLPASEPGETKELTYVTDERNWHSGVHGGARRVRHRTLPRTDFPAGEPR
jgi:CRISPR system Cascade subunit CasD